MNIIKFYLMNLLCIYKKYMKKKTLLGQMLNFLTLSTYYISFYALLQPCFI